MNHNPRKCGGLFATSLRQTCYQTRVRLFGYNAAVNVFGALSDRDGARVLRRTAPSLGRRGHAVLSARHLRLARLHQQRWGKALDDAAMSHFGRPFDIADYRISAIGLDEFDESFKRRARLHAHAFTRHDLAARAHRYAARYFRRFPQEN